MSDQRTMILKMLESGKITATEASQLLEALSTGDAENHEPHENRQNYSQTNRQDPPPRRQASEKNNSDDFEQKIEAFGRNLSKKIGVLTKEMEPKLKKMTEVVVDVTATTADKISKSISQMTDSERDTTRQYDTRSTAPRPPSPSRPPSPTSMTATAKTFEIIVNERDSELILSGFNGNVSLKGYNGDKITAKVYYKTRDSKASIDLIKLGNKYVFDYQQENFKEVSIEAYIPEFMFSQITVETINGNLSLHTLKVGDLLIKNLNGNTDLSDLNCGKIDYESSNGSLDITNVVSQKATFENFNGRISIKGIDVEHLQIESFNESIIMNVLNLANFNNYIWNIESSNGELDIIAPSGFDIGYHLEARTSLSKIKIGLTGINYISNSETHAEVKSFHYDDAQKKVRMKLQTSNGNLSIN